MSRLRPLWFVTLIATAVIVLGTMLWRLDAQTVQNWDESIHGQVSREMVESREWVDLQYRGGDYFRKPPLSFWLRSVTIAALGDTVWSLRVWSGIAGVLTALLVGWWAWQRWRNRWIALLAVLVFTAGRFVFFHVFRSGEGDGLLTLFVTLSLYAGWRARVDSRWLLLTGAATGLAVLTKSAAGFLPIPILLLDALVTRSWPYRWKHVLTAALVFLAVAAPWHVVEHVRHGSAFWNDYLGFHVFERATTAIHNPDAGPLYYVTSFARRFFPFSLFFPFAFFAMAWGLRRDRRTGDALLLAWFVVVFVFFTLTATKFDWYLAPLYPAAALVVTPWLATLVQRPSWKVIGAQAVSFSAVLFFLPDTVHPESAARWIYPLTLLVHNKPSALYLVLNAVAIAVFLLAMPRTRPRWLAPVLGGYALGKVLLFAVSFSLLTIRALRPEPPLPHLAALIEQQPNVTTLYSRGTDLIHYPAAYWYFERLDLRLVDLERAPAPEQFTAGDLIVVRDPAEPPTGSFDVVGRSDDFTVYRLSTGP